MVGLYNYYRLFTHISLNILSRCIWPQIAYSLEHMWWLTPKKGETLQIISILILSFHLLHLSCINCINWSSDQILLFLYNILSPIFISFLKRVMSVSSPFRAESSHNMILDAGSYLAPIPVTPGLPLSPFQGLAFRSSWSYKHFIP